MWQLIVALVGLIILAYTLMPKPQSMKPTGINDVRLPTSEEGREIPVFGGTVFLEAPNCAWYGDYRAIPIKSKGSKK